MEDWRPRPRAAVDPRGLPLDAEEGFLLSRLDGATSLPELRALTGLGAARLEALLHRLIEVGAIDGPTKADPSGASPVPPRATPAPPGGTSDAVRAAALAAHAKALGVRTPEAGEAMAADARDEADTERERADEDEEEDLPAAEARQLSARALFGQFLRHLDEAERTTRAAVADDPELSAFCFDPLPTVARALIGNPHFTIAHARMLARFHTSSPGLEALALRGAVARDPVVERCLLRNANLPGGAARRMLTPLRLLRLWLLHVDREVPELARKLSKDVLRSRFGTAPAEERVDLILRTDGRVLMSLGGVAVDGRTASLLCQRSYRSPLLIQNLARWSACPVPLLVHLWNQPAVRQQQLLRQALLRHPNLPSELKRSG